MLLQTFPLFAVSLFGKKCCFDFGRLEEFPEVLQIGERHSSDEPPIVVSFEFKPTPTLYKPQINLNAGLVFDFMLKISLSQGGFVVSP